MAESGAFKTLNDKDVVSTRTLLHEAIPITGTIVSGTYADGNIKNPSHGMFQSVYDYPYLSSSANHIFDITVGVGIQSGLTVTSQADKKKNIYNQMAQLLVGYDHTGSIQRFDEDGNIVGGGKKLDDVFIIPFSRLLVKDEIKKGTFQLELGIDDAYDNGGAIFNSRILISDQSGSNGYFVNSPVGEYGVLYATASTHTAALALDQSYAVGLLYYQAGIAVISGSVFNDAAIGGILNNALNSTDLIGQGAVGFSSVSASTTQTIASGIRNRIYNVQFNNTTELNSTIYFCRANHQEFNYSTNPTYTNASKIRVKTNSTDEPVSYITTIGLYNDKNELMATAKLSEPLKKTPSTEFTIRCRLDY